MKKINKQKNEIIIPRGIVLVNNRGERCNITQKTNIKKALKKIIGGYDKVASIKYREGEKPLKRIERIDDSLLSCKFQGERNLHILKFEKLIEITNFYVLNYYGKLKLPDLEYIGDIEDYDIFKINKRQYKLEGILLNKDLITLFNINKVEKIISDILNNFENISINAIVVKNVDTNELRILELSKINTEYEMGISKINMKIKGYKNEKKIELNENSALFEVLYNIASMKIDYFTDA
jgi:hypothetical protein